VAVKRLPLSVIVGLAVVEVCHDHNGKLVVLAAVETGFLVVAVKGFRVVVVTDCFVTLEVVAAAAEVRAWAGAWA